MCVCVCVRACVRACHATNWQLINPIPRLVYTTVQNVPPYDRVIMKLQCSAILKHLFLDIKICDSALGHVLFGIYYLEGGLTRQCYVYVHRC